MFQRSSTSKVVHHPASIHSIKPLSNMVVLKPDVPFGHAPHPQTPFSILSNLPGWELTKGIREGDMSPMARVKHIYPRFCPWGHAAQLGVEIAKRTGHEGKATMPFLNPETWPYALRHSTSPLRDEQRVPPEALTVECVEINGERIFVCLFEPQYGRTFMSAWQFSGLGVSQRHAEKLIEGIEGLQKVEGGLDNIPEPTWTKEGGAHQALKERISELLHRAPIDPEKVACTAKDVFLYPTGMAAIWYMASWLSQIRPGAAVVMGIPFHNTYHHLLEEAKGGMVNFGGVDEKGLDEFEAWLVKETEEGRRVSWVYVEFSCNPSMETPDIERLKKLSEEYGFTFVIDDTLSGFGNVDIFANCDMLLTSLTKSFNGLADAMGGSIVFNPLSPHYPTLSGHWSSNFRNEVFVDDAAVLLKNSEGFVERTAALNRNASAMAEHLQNNWVGKPGSPVTAVRYPSLLASRSYYDKFLRPSTPELPSPGYGCLLTIDFTSEALAAKFYDSLGFYPTPHLAAPVSLHFAYNMLVFGKKPKEREYVRQYGLKEEAVRISAGWKESAEDLIETLEDALKVTAEAVTQNGDGVEKVNGTSQA